MSQKIQIENYLDQKVNPILEQLLTQLIKNKPKNVLNYCKNWIEKKSQAVQSQQQQSESDSEQEQNRITELLQRKGRNKWYQQRKGICGEVYGNYYMWQQVEVPSVAKKSIVNSRILFRLKSLFLFKDFDDGDINKLISTMTQVSYQPGNYIIREGLSGVDMFVVDSGELECIKGSPGAEGLVKLIRQGEMFGENSMLYNVPRWASIRAKTNCILFRLQRKTYHSIINERNIKKRKIFQSSLLKIQILKELDNQQKYKLQDLITQIPVHQNQYVIRQGKHNKTLYIIESGKFVSLKKQKTGHDKIMNQFKEGDVFGEICLVSKKPATQSIMSLTNGKLFGIEKQGLQRVLGSVTKIMKRSMDLYDKYKNYDLC